VLAIFSGMSLLYIHLGYESTLGIVCLFGVILVERMILAKLSKASITAIKDINETSKKQTYLHGQTTQFLKKLVEDFERRTG
jgi:hypothetical protein